MNTRITVKCATAGCPKGEEEEVGSFPQARRWAKEHVRHTNHRVVVDRHEITWFEPGDDD